MNNPIENPNTGVTRRGPITVDRSGAANVFSDEARRFMQQGGTGKIPDQVGNVKAPPSVPGLEQATGRPAGAQAPAQQSGWIAKLRSAVGLGDAAAAAADTPTTQIPRATFGAPGAGTVRGAAHAAFGAPDEWSRFAADNSRVVSGAGKVLNVLGKGVAVLGGAKSAYDMTRGAMEGDAGRAALGAADTAAFVGLATPAAPAAATYLTGRGIYEGYHALPQAYTDNIKNSLNAFGKVVDSVAGTQWHDPTSPAWQRMEKNLANEKAGKVKLADGTNILTEDEADRTQLIKSDKAKGGGALASAALAASTSAGSGTPPTAKAGGQATADSQRGDPIGDAARAGLLRELEREAAADKDGVRSTSFTREATGEQTDRYVMADGRTLTVPGKFTAGDAKLLTQADVIDLPDNNQGGPVVIDGRSYHPVHYGTDENGLPVYKGLSVAGGADSGYNATELIRKVLAAKERQAGLADEDRAAIERYQARDARRAEIDAQYPEQMDAPAAPSVPAAPRGGSSFAHITDPAQRRNVQVFAQALAGAEGADYNTVVGGGKFDDYSKHPAVVGMRTKDGPSTAAGRYQITGSTWNDLVKQHGLQDFSPESQDRAFLALLERRGALDDVLAGRYDAAVAKLGQEWQGLPSGTSKNQGKRTPEQWQQLLAQAGAAIDAQGAPSPIQQAATRDPFAGAVGVIKGVDQHVEVPGASGYVPMETAAYDAYRQALGQNPDAANRIVLTRNGPMVDGVPVPPNIVAMGNLAIDAYLAQAAQGATYAANPVAAKLAEEAAKSQGQQEVARIQATRQPEYIKLDGAKGVDASGAPYQEGDRVFSTKDRVYIDQGAGNLRASKPPLPDADIISNAEREAKQFPNKIAALNKQLQDWGIKHTIQAK